MIPCACSLRSTQCAALIALATAAGIVRFDSRQSLVLSPATEQSRETEARPERHSIPYQIALHAAAPWLWVARYAAPTLNPTAAKERHDLAGAVIAGPSAAPPPAPLPIAALQGVRAPDFLAWVQPAPSARNHSFPFAVGPPRPANHATHRAAGTQVPGDSAADALFLSWIAHLTVRFARPARLEFVGPSMAAPSGPPSFALRGEPASNFSRWSTDPTRRGLAVIAPPRPPAPATLFNFNPVNPRSDALRFSRPW